MLINHLIEVHARRRVSFLQGPEGYEDSIWRERGYRQALMAHGLPFDPQLVACGGFNDQKSYLIIQQWILDGVDFDAVFACDDDAAIGVIAALKKAGHRVPEDVSVVGFDDIPLSRFLSPPLTTVRAPIEQVGREAVRLLVKCIHEESCLPEILLPIELVIRQSCGCGIETTTTN
jgi:DNA-binding LacI/PurR family transcriptional regulator